MIFIFLIISPLLRWILSGFLVMIGGWVFRRLWRAESLSMRQRSVKGILNAAWLILAILFLFQPFLPWHRSREALLVHDSGIPADVTDSVQAARKIKHRVSYREFKKKFREYADHRLFFLGREAEPQILSRLAGKKVQWIPWFAPDALQDLAWEG
ncbi:MAG: hypothetical protein LRY55_03325, partial [Leadbetterella sp.]|nr:hypothetical protein [Leadbetterella sp.]